MFCQMEEQASHITKLMEENRRYIRENGKLKSRTRGGVVNSDGYGNGGYGQAKATGLEDRVLALQLQNSELSLCLEQERRRRKEAETRLEQDEGYIKRLEDSVQNLRGTRVVMDPITYRQVAEAYMAARRTPARRPTHAHPHTHSYGDLVCDSTNHDSSSANSRLSHTPSLNDSTSYTSSFSTMDPSTSSPSLGSDTSSTSLYDSTTRKSRKARGCGGNEHSSATSGTSMNPWDYQQLLESLEDLEGGSRGALS